VPAQSLSSAGSVPVLLIGAEKDIGESYGECPYKPLLDFDTFAQGTPRAYIDELRGEHRILWQADSHATGGHWLLFQQADIDFVLRSTELFTNNFGPLLEDIPATYCRNSSRR